MVVLGTYRSEKDKGSVEALRRLIQQRERERERKCTPVERAGRR